LQQHIKQQIKNMYKIVTSDDYINYKKECLLRKNINFFYNKHVIAFVILAYKDNAVIIKCIITNSIKKKIYIHKTAYTLFAFFAYSIKYVE